MESGEREITMSGNFDPPRLAINRVYTRQGDAGETHLAGGQRLPKNDIRIEAYGTIDELSSFIGVARESLRAHPELAELEPILLRVQHELFNAGSILATLPEDVHPKQARITPAESEQLEREIDRMNAGLPPLRSFVLPGGCRINAELHVCRTVCRRAERVCVSMSSSAPPEIVRYLNRLSDALFVWSRWVSCRLGIPETLWEPNQASSSRLGHSGLPEGANIGRIENHE
ncbi:MAG: cob(I)yrinic acid a,c-diamide adenosyltransferase [Acidobacteriota bacterium]|nr:cob(I)yrinic acid a,c-diamide adenosyltransferase [Acidobacteriota bacterium]